MKITNLEVKKVQNPFYHTLWGLRPPTSSEYCKENASMGHLLLIINLSNSTWLRPTIYPWITKICDHVPNLKGTPRIVNAEW